MFKFVRKNILFIVAVLLVTGCGGGGGGSDANTNPQTNQEETNSNNYTPQRPDSLAPPTPPINNLKPPSI